MRSGRIVAGIAVVAAASAGIVPAEEPPVAHDHLKRFAHLDPGDPRELAMKLRSLARDPYTYFRGSTAEFYELVKETAPEWLDDSAVWVQLHGDIHIGNVGTYQGPGEPGRDTHFGVVDLDETIAGPFQLDLLRAMTAVRFAAETGGSKAGEDVMREATTAMCSAYVRALTSQGGDHELIARYEEVAVLMRKAAKNEIRKYIGRYADLTPEMRFKKARIKDGAVKDILEPVDDKERDEVTQAVWNYLETGTSPSNRKEFRYERIDDLRADVRDVARWTRVESSGSQGVHKYLVLLEKPLRNYADPLILELKEQPPPAALVTGILKARSGVDRAAEVAAGYGQLLSPAPRLVGHTRVGDRGFLVRTKDPWGEEFEPTDFGMNANASGITKAASILGEVIGMAHRNGLSAASRTTQVALLRERAESLDQLLCERSKVIHERMSARYAEFSSDNKVKELIRQADEFVEKYNKK